MRRKYFSNRCGILLLSLLLMMTLMTLAMVFIKRVVGSARTGQSEVDRIQALYTAEAGLQKAIYYLNYTAPDSTIGGSYRIGTASSTACPSTGGSAGLSEVLTISTGNTATYTMCIENSGYNVKITSTGTVVSGINGNVTRTVQAKTSQPLLATTSGGVNAANLLARWNFTEGAGSSTADSSGNGYTGTLYNIGGLPTWSSAALNDGVTHGYLTFNGTNGAYATVTSVPQQSFTVTGWVKPVAGQLGALSSVGFISNADAASSGGMGFHLVFYHQLFKLLIEASNGTTYATTASVVAWSVGTWYHFAAVYDNTYKYGYIYLNGADATVSSPVSMKNVYGFSHTYTYWGYDFVTGYTSSFASAALADIRIYSRALKAAEIAQIYSGSGTAIKMLKGSFKEL